MLTKLGEAAQAADLPRIAATKPPMSKILNEKSSSDAASAPSANFKAMLLRAIAQELADKIIPSLNSPDAIDRAQLARLITENLAADLDVLPGVAARVAPQMQQTIQNAIDSVDKSSGDRVSALADELRRAPLEIDTLRNLAARLLRYLADQDHGIVPPATLTTLGRIDALWLKEFAAATHKLTATSATPASGAAAAPSDALTAEQVTRYLRRRFPAAPAISASELTRVPGGRSKKTYFMSISGSDVLPKQVVIRQDYALKYAGTKIVDEYRPLMMLAERGLPVPRPLHLEAEPSEIGPPFMLVPRFTGKPPGSYFGMVGTAPGAFRDLPPC